MAATWDEFLQEASFDGLLFDMVSIRVEGGRELDRREYPNRDGAEIRDLARKALTLQVRAVFVGDAYPETYEAFLAKLNAGGVRELVHPVHGRIQAAPEHWTDTSDADDACDFAAVEVTFAEHTDNALGPFEGSDAASLANLVRSACDDIDTAAAKLRAFLDGPSAPASPANLQAAVINSGGISAQFAAASSSLEEDGDTMSAGAIAAIVNVAIVAAAATIALVSNYQSPESHGLGVSLVAGCARLEQLGAQIIAAKPPLVTITVKADTPLLLFVHDRYGDSSRAGEVLRLNSLPDPILIPSGFGVVCYAF